MPDERKHRGPHPQDRRLFGVEQVAPLCRATHELSWLLTRGYAATSALKLVGDRHALDVRQRLAVARCACADEDAARRRSRQMGVTDLRRRELWIDGYNVLTSVEAALSGGVILVARDGCYRDMASMHGSYRKVEETIPALQLLGELIAPWNVSACCWLLDQPVSNSGRLKALLLAVGEQQGWPWRAELVPDPDSILVGADQIVASADSRILDGAGRWFNLARIAIDLRIPDAWIVDLTSPLHSA